MEASRRRRSCACAARGDVAARAPAVDASSSATTCRSTWRCQRRRSRHRCRRSRTSRSGSPATTAAEDGCGRRAALALADGRRAAACGGRRRARSRPPTALSARRAQLRPRRRRSPAGLSRRSALRGRRGRGSSRGLVVPVRPDAARLRRAARGGRRSGAGRRAPSPTMSNLALRGPLTGRWPAGVPRSLPVADRRISTRCRSCLAAGLGYTLRSPWRESPMPAGSRRSRPRRSRGLALCRRLRLPRPGSPSSAAYHGLKLAACGRRRRRTATHEE